MSEEKRVNYVVEEEDELEKLFKIGDEYINKNVVLEIESNSYEEERGSRDRGREKSKSRSRQKKEKRQKKIKKEKKDKKQKKDKKDKKSKKQKDRKQKYLDIIQINDSPKPKSLNPYSQIPSDPLQSLFTTDFVYNQKLNLHTLPVSVIKFPEAGLQEYGITSHLIPKYSRLPYNFLPGLSSSKQIEQILRQLNIKINQVTSKNKQQDLNNRYFYFKLNQSRQTIKPRRTKPNADPYYISFNSQEWSISQTYESLKSLAIDYRGLANSQLLKTNKEYNLKLSSEPNNVKLWIDFINAQDKMVQYFNGENEQKELNERKMSILQKALELNPLNTQLKIKQLELVYLKNFDDYYRITLKKSWQIISTHPQDIEAWQIYLFHKFSSLNNFNGYSISQQATKIKEFMMNKITQAKSAKLVWSIRKTLIHIMFILVDLLEMAGYQEISTGVCISLLELNVFAPSDITLVTDHDLRLRRFRDYWEDIGCYRVGDVDEVSYWSNSKKYQVSVDETYIGFIEGSIQQKLQNNYENRTENWRMAFPRFDQQRIIQSPCSYVLFQDIEPFLYAYKDKQNIEVLIDRIFESLGFPPVFSNNNTPNSKFTLNYLETRIKRLIETKQSYRPYFKNTPDFWMKFWNLEQTSLLITTQFTTKLIYIKRILRSLQEKLPNIQISLYLLFIQSAIYLTPQLQTLLYSQQTAKQQILKIIQTENSNILIWIGYIRVESIKSSNYEECYKVYFDLIYQQKQQFNIMQLFYYLLISTTKWQYKQDSILFYLFKYLKQGEIVPPKQEQIQEKQLTPFQVLYFQQLLSRQYQTIIKSQSQEEIVNMFKYFILKVCEIFEPIQTIRQIREQIINQCCRTISVRNSLLLLRTQHRIQIRKQQILNIQLSETTSQLLLKGYHQPIFMLRTFKKFDVITWVQIFLYHKNPTENNVRYFIKQAQNILLANTFVKNNPREKIRVWRIMKLFDSRENVREYELEILKSVPYSKELFASIIRESQTTQEQKLFIELFNQKMLRV